MEMVATGSAPQAKPTKDEVFSVELQSQVQARLYLQTTKFSLKLETKGNTPKTYAISHKTLLFVSNFKENYTLLE